MNAQQFAEQLKETIQDIKESGTSSIYTCCTLKFSSELFPII